MRCPSCGNLESKVVDSRPSDDGSTIRRRRECLDCHHRFTTYERLSDNPMLVIKSDGSSETYDRNKLMRGITVACAKRSITPDQINQLIDEIETELRSVPRGELYSKAIGTKILKRLEKLDDVAYVRFASVYKDFKNIEEFAAALEEIR